MPIRMTGLNSGLDTESIIAALMSAQRTKQTKVENKKTKLEWKKEQWASLNTKIYNFYTNSLSKMKMKSTYMTKAATSSNTSKVTAKASTTAATGSYSVKVKNVASAQKVTSGKLNQVAVKDDKGQQVIGSDGKPVYENVTSSTKLKDIMGDSLKPGTQIKVAAGDKTVFLEVNDKTTVSDFVGKLNNAGLNASFDENQQRFFISSAKSGAGNSFTITSGTMDQNQQDATKALKDLIGYESMSSANKATADNIMAKLQTGASVDDVIERLTTLANDYSDKKAKDIATKLYTAEAKDTISKNFDDEVKKSLEKESINDSDRIKYLEDKGFKLDKTDGKTDEEALKKALNEAKNKYIDKEAEKLIKKDDYKTKIEEAANNGLSSSEKDRLNALLKNDEKLTTEEAGIITTNRMDRTIATNSAIAGNDKEPGAAKKYSEAMKNFGSDDGDNGEGTKLLKAIGLGRVAGDLVSKGQAATDSSQMAVIAAGDTEIEYNGAILTSDTTNITVAGIELNVLAETGDETVNISVTNDTSGVYDTIKEFISEYNAILKEMNTLYNAGSAKDYDVLSDEEKDAMSDSEVEKWESKIKDSLLRRDTTLGGIISSFKDKMMGTYTTSGGSRFSLAAIGISTSQDYKEGGLLHIRGEIGRAHV